MQSSELRVADWVSFPHLKVWAGDYGILKFCVCVNGWNGRGSLAKEIKKVFVSYRSYVLQCARLLASVSSAAVLSKRGR